MNSLYSYKPTRTIIGGNNVQEEFDSPTKVCYDEWNHKIIVSDTCNNRIQFFNSKTYKFNSILQLSEYNYPTGLCIQPFTNHLIVSNAWDNNINIFDCNNNYALLYQIHRSMDSLNSVTSVCCDEKGHILYTDPCNHRVQEYSELGRFLSVFGSKGSSSDQFLFPKDVCYDKKYHQLLVADHNNMRLNIWSHDSCSKPTPVSQIIANDYCHSVCIDPLRNHQILIGTNFNVLVYDVRNHKEPIQVLGSGKEGGLFSIVSGLCVNEQDGTLIIVDNDHQQIHLHNETLYFF